MLPAHRRQELRFPTVVPAGALPGRPPSPPEHLTSNLQCAVATCAVWQLQGLRKSPALATQNPMDTGGRFLPH